MKSNIQKAIDFATKKHNEPTRFGIPFCKHFMQVYENIKSVEPAAEDLQIAGLLHDTMEDTYTSAREIKENFGENVASLVVELTDPEVLKYRIIGNLEFLKKELAIDLSSGALTVKLADRLAHMQIPFGIDIDEAIERPEVASKLNMEITKDALIYLKKERKLNHAQTVLIERFFSLYNRISLKLKNKSYE